MLQQMSALSIYGRACAFNSRNKTRVNSHQQNNDLWAQYASYLANTLKLKTMNKTALITGASSGIGAELARKHAKKGGNLILVARRKELLETLKQELEQQYSVSVLAICKDLNQPDATHELYEQTKDLNVEILINNAGFGLLGAFDQAEIDKIESMIHVNVMALTTLTRLFLPDMLRRNSGKILNIASTASFMPGPLQAVYFATKAYVRSLSWALSEEVRNSSVTVTTLCPGPTLSLIHI